MADQVTTRRLDDLHLREGRQIDADRRYEFALGDTTYRLDLDKSNAALWEEAITPFLDAATPIQKDAPKTASSGRTTKRRVTGGTSTRRTSKETTALIRQWAEDSGIMLKPKGPLPGDIKQRYADAQGIDVATLT